MKEQYGQDKQKTDGSRQKRLKAKDWIFLIFALIYTISPIDLIADIPFAGYIDDLFLDGAAIANFFQKLTADNNQTLSAVLKILKKLFLLFGAIVVLLLFILTFLFFKTNN